MRLPAAFGLALLIAVSNAPAEEPLDVVSHLPAVFVRDGSVSYQRQLQQALDAAAEQGRPLRFPSGTWLLDDPVGLRVHSGQTLLLRGARFTFSPEILQDGQAFLGENVRDVCFLGGEIVGRNDVWPSGTNVRGIHLTGECANIRVQDMTLRNLSSNGVGMFGSDETRPARDVWLIDTVIDNCCNFYGDYQAPPPTRRGPESGSVREDQGLVAFYHVENFVVRGCRFENSRSDGTHFYKCSSGQFSDNKVYRAQMGGYFLETCEHVVATGNIIRENGSRGVTIERGSRACILASNTIEGSGREGLWMPDCLHCVASGNLFLRNGRKENGSLPRNIWNANITINESRGDPSNSPAEKCVISNNLIDTGANQVAAIRVDTTETVREITIEGNILVGENRNIQIDGDHPENVRTLGNIGAEPAVPLDAAAAPEDNR
jgi:hypothetical protein